MRLPYAPSTAPTNSDPITAAAYTQLAARRSPNPLLPLDLALLHSPAVASGWSSFLGSIRTQTSLPADIRELCICRVAALNGADFEWEHHIPILKAEGGLTEEAAEEIKSRKAWRGWEDTIGGGGKGEGEVGGNLNERQRAVLAYTDAMTVGVKVPDEVFAPLKGLFRDNEVVEITATVAAYNCVSRFLVALDVGEMSEKESR
jgi:alkylhydroperoxidase family enzyme